MRLNYRKLTEPSSGIIKSSNHTRRDEPQQRKPIQYCHTLKKSPFSNTMLSPSSSLFSSNTRDHTKSFSVVTPNSSQKNVASAYFDDDSVKSLTTANYSPSEPIVKNRSDFLALDSDKDTYDEDGLYNVCNIISTSSGDLTETSIKILDGLIPNENRKKNDTSSPNNILFQDNVSEDLSESETEDGLSNEKSSSSEYLDDLDLADTLGSLSLMDGLKSNDAILIPPQTPNHHKDTLDVNESDDSITPHHEKNSIFPYKGATIQAFRKSCVDPVAMALLNESTCSSDHQSCTLAEDGAHHRSDSVESCSPVSSIPDSVSSTGMRYISDSLMDVKSEDEVALLHRPIALPPEQR